MRVQLMLLCNLVFIGYLGDITIAWLQPIARRLARDADKHPKVVRLF